MLAIAAVASLAPAGSARALGAHVAAPNPNRLANGGFETGLAAPWSGGPGWGLDRSAARGGAFSYRRDGGAPTATTTLDLAPGVYRFSAWVKTKELADGLRLRFDVRPAAHSWFTTEIAGGTHDWRLYELTDLVVDQPATVTLKLEAEDGAAGTAWFDDVRVDEQRPQPLRTFLLYPNFRGAVFEDGPSTLTFDVQVTPPAGEFARYSVRGLVRDAATGHVVTTASYPARAAFVAELDSRGMQPGTAYLASFALIDQATAAEIVVSPTHHVSRAAMSTRASRAISFDHRNRVLVHGVPRFLLGSDDPRIARAAAAATELRWWRDLADADIVATDPQPMFGPEPAGGYDHGVVATATARARAAVRDSRPVVAVLPFVPLSSLGRWPSRVELRSHAYMAIVEGARGLWWSSVGDDDCHQCAASTHYLDDLRTIVSELAALEPMLLADDTPGVLAGNSNSNIKAKVKHVNGKGFVVAYNASSRRQSATFTWSTAPGTVTVHGEDRTLAASGRSFSDTFAPFAAHVYVIGDAAAEGN